MVQGNKENPCSCVTHKTRRYLFKQGRKQSVIYEYRNSEIKIRKLTFDTI